VGRITAAASAIIPIGEIERRILFIRGQRVMLDADLARVYGVPTKRLNEQVKRNADRFPADFMFQLTWEEATALRLQSLASRMGRKPRSRSQNATLKRGGNVKYRPCVFTEHGAIMAANVLNPQQAVTASVFVVRAFVKLREMLATHRQLAGKLAELERRLEKHDGQIIALIEAIRQLMAPPPDPPRKRIGFASEIAGSEDVARGASKSRRRLSS
jgi:hypothetical protein